MWLFLYPCSPGNGSRLHLSYWKDTRSAILVLFHITIRNTNQVLFIILSITHWESTLTYSPKVVQVISKHITRLLVIVSIVCLSGIRILPYTVLSERFAPGNRTSDFHNNTYIQSYIDLIVASLTLPKETWDDIYSRNSFPRQAVKLERYFR